MPRSLIGVLAAHSSSGSAGAPNARIMTLALLQRQWPQSRGEIAAIAALLARSRQPVGMCAGEHTSRSRSNSSRATWSAAIRTCSCRPAPGSVGLANPELKLSYPHLSAAIVVPIILRDELVGVVNISSRSPNVRYDEDDMRALKMFAENAGTCIRNTERAQWMRTTIESLREQLARAQQALPS